MTSPALFRPKAVGAGLVVNALTKYIGGHGNALAGSITDTGLFDWTRYPEHRRELQVAAAARLWGIQQMRKKGLRDWGGTLAAEQAHHIAVGAETLALRMERICANALALARVARGASARCAPSTTRASPSHPQHALATAALPRLRRALVVRARRRHRLLRFPQPAARSSCSSSNLGDNRTLAIPVAHTIFWEMGAERRAAMGIADSLIRVSVGIEDRDDLIADFAQALKGG